MKHRRRVWVALLAGAAALRCSAQGQEHDLESSAPTAAEELTVSTPDLSCTAMPGFDPRQYCLNLGVTNVITGNGQATVIEGTPGPDCILGSSQHETINAGDGNDIVFGGFGNDAIHGQGGNDEIYGEAEHDTISGEEGDDVLHGGDQIDTIDGGPGNDTIVGGGDHNHLFGGDGDDEIFGGTGNDDLHGGPGNDAMIDCSGSNIVDAPQAGDRCRLNAQTPTNGCSTRACGSAPEPSSHLADLPATASHNSYLGLTRADLVVGLGWPTNELHRFSPNGGSPTLIANDLDGRFDTDGEYVYYDAGSTLRRAPAAGGRLSRLFHSGGFSKAPLVVGRNLIAFERVQPPDLDVVASLPLSPFPTPGTVLFVDNASDSYHTFFVGCGKIYHYSHYNTALVTSRDAAGGAPRDLGFFSFVMGLAASPTHLYVSTSREIYRISLATGASQLMVPWTDGIYYRKMMVDAESLYIMTDTFTDLAFLGSRFDRLPINGGALTTIETHNDRNIWDIAQDSRRYYLLLDDEVRRGYK